MMPDTTRDCAESELDTCVCVYGEWYSSFCESTGLDCIDGKVDGIDHMYRDYVSGPYDECISLDVEDQWYMT